MSLLLSGFKATASPHAAGLICFLSLIFFLFLIEQIPSGYFLPHLTASLEQATKAFFLERQGARAEPLQRECKAAVMSLSLSSPVCLAPVVLRPP